MRPRPRLVIHLLAAAAILVLAAGPAAASTHAAGNAPTIVTEPIDMTDVHHEPDGSTTTLRLLGTRTTFTFPDGRYILREAYTDQQIARDASGALIYESLAETSVNVIARGERTISLRTSSETVMTLGDGSECTLSSTLIVANDKVVKSEFIGPICS